MEEKLSSKKDKIFFIIGAKKKIVEKNPIMPIKNPKITSEGKCAPN